MRRYLLLASLANGASSFAQPFLDVVNTAWVYSPDRLARGEVNTNLPVKLDSAGTLLVISPSFERWMVEVPPPEMRDTAARHDGLNGFALPITFITTLVPEKWKLSITGIGRYMTIADPDRGDYQLGGAFLLQRVKSPSLTWKFGAYANADAFGLFALPLLGIDWRHDRDNLFGVLPGSLTYERKCARWYHWGAVYKAITTSFGTRTGGFRRVDENTVGLYLDIYPVKTICLRIEAGHTALSQYQGGSLDPWYPAGSHDHYVDHLIGDGPYMKLMLAYRVRLDG